VINHTMVPALTPSLMPHHRSQFGLVQDQISLGDQMSLVSQTLRLCGGKGSHLPGDNVLYFRTKADMDSLDLVFSEVYDHD
jgi:hypothetical protein